MSLNGLLNQRLTKAHQRLAEHWTTSFAADSTADDSAQSAEVGQWNGEVLFQSTSSIAHPAQVADQSPQEPEKAQTLSPSRNEIGRFALGSIAAKKSEITTTSAPSRIRGRVSRSTWAN